MVAPRDIDSKVDGTPSRIMLRVTSAGITYFLLEVRKSTKAETKTNSSHFCIVRNYFNEIIIALKTLSCILLCHDTHGDGRAMSSEKTGNCFLG